MFSYLLVIVILAAGLILYGLLNADVEEVNDAVPESCRTCSDRTSCGESRERESADHFSFHRPLTPLSKLFR